MFPAILLIIIFLAVIYPAWAIVHCVRSPNWGPAGKTVWIVLIAFFWTFGAILYGLFAARARVLSAVSWVILLAIISFSFWGLSVIDAEIKDLNTSLAASSQKLAEVSFTGLPDDTRAVMGHDLAQLQRDLNAPGLRQGFQNKFKTMSLHTFYIKITNDAAVTPAEYKDWRATMDSRKLIDPNALQDFVTDYGAFRPPQP